MKQAKKKNHKISPRTRSVKDFELDYSLLCAQVPSPTKEGLIEFLSEELPYAWRAKYLGMTPRQTNLFRFHHLGFEYLFDHYSDLVAKKIVPFKPGIEDRIIGVLGRSSPNSEPRDNAALRAWVGPTGKRFGKGIDKGHFMAHTIGGELGINIFPQLRVVNRGWSLRGKVYRSMETYCAENQGTFCFSRPIYADDSARPVMVEFGVLMATGKLWVERFENYP